jgi:hypothetical protein
MRLALLALLPVAAWAASLPVEQGEESSILRPIGPRQSTCVGSNVAGGRDKWCSGFDINTDYDLSFPDSGKLVEVCLRNPSKTRLATNNLVIGHSTHPECFLQPRPDRKEGLLPH